MGKTSGVGQGIRPATAIEHQAQAAIAALLQVEEVLTVAGQQWGRAYPVVGELAALRHLARDAITANQAIIRLLQQKAPDRLHPTEAETNG